MRNFSEHNAVVGRIAPISQGTGSVNTGAIELKHGRRYTFVLKTGVMGASGTLDFKVQASPTSGGTYADVPGAAITQVVKASGDNKVVIVEVSPEAVVAELPGSQFIRGLVTVGTAASLIDVTVIASHLRYSPAADFDLADVVQIVSKVN